jgi:4'-phosphopantetheinyl transferase
MIGATPAEHELVVDIGECALDTDADIALDHASALLDDRERARAASFVFAHDRDRFVRAHGYLRRRLGASLRLAPQDVLIVGEEGEKPFVEGREVSFSLSHSGSHAVVAVTRGREIGVDLELVNGGRGLDDQIEDLARMVFTAEEQDALQATPPASRVHRFLSYWTAKEARMKLTGEGMALEPNTISLELSGGLPVGYLRPKAPAANLRFVPMSRPDAICCLAVGCEGGGMRPAPRGA